MSRTFITLMFAFSCAAYAVADEKPLHTRIDEQIARHDFGLAAAQCDDATFLRRATLALAGRIPTRDEVSRFLEDPASEKRQPCIDRLLKSDDFLRHMAITFELMLMERRSGAHIKTAAFRSYLESAFRDQKSWLDIACEVLAADGSEKHNRAAAGFFLQRDVEPHLLTRDTGRIFFGMDLQCAQCHDHPMIDDYRQDDYYGLNAFFVRATLFQPDTKKPAFISETAAGEATFKSVFTDREGNLLPRIPGGTELTEAKRKPHERYQVVPDAKTRGVPVESRLSKLSRTLRTNPTPQFDRNIVNRLWAHMFGRGLVHPVDLHHSMNPPTHPELLELLATEFRQQNYDIPWLLREIALTDTWQRDFRLPNHVTPTKEKLHASQQPGDQAEGRSKQAAAEYARYQELLDQVDETVENAKPLFEAETAAMKKIEAAMKPHKVAQSAFKTTEAKADKLQRALAALNQSLEQVEGSTALLKDESLDDIAAKLTQVITKQKTVLPQLKSKVSAAQKKLTAAQTALDDAIAAADPAMDAVRPIDEKIRKLRRQAYKYRLRSEVLYTAREAEDKRTQVLNAIVQHHDLNQSEKSLAAKITEHSTDLENLQKQLPTLESELKSASVQYAQLQSAAEELDSRHQQSEADLVELNQQCEALEEAVLSVGQLTTAMPELSEADALLSALQERLDGTNQVKQQQQQTLNEQTDSSLAAARKATDAKEQLQATERRHVDMTTRLKQARQSLRNLKQELAETKQEQSALQTEISNAALNRFAAAQLTALTPEQLAWSLLTATGQIERQKAGIAAKLAKEKPLSDKQKNDPKALQQRAHQIETAAHKALVATVNKFASLYGASAGQPQEQFFATAEQSLFLANGAEIRSWLVPGNGNLTDRVMKLEDPSAKARELYLSVLSRNPTSQETTDVVSYLKQHGEQKSDAVREIAWGLLTSAEFRFQH